MMNLIRSCSELQDSDWTVDKLSNTDLEWLFIQIRMKSVGESTKVILPCVKQPEGCDGQTPVNIEFDKMRKRILRHLNQRSEMLSGISHDLRTPLTRMKLQLAFIKDKDTVKKLTEPWGVTDVQSTH